MRLKKGDFLFWVDELGTIIKIKQNYNATEKRDQEISFKIIPTVEGWEKIKK